MKIKAISLWQPWASLIAVGAKEYETRAWATSYRGPLLICAAKKTVDKNTLRWVNKVLLYEDKPAISIGDLRFGYAVALVDLTRCINTESTVYGRRLTAEGLSRMEEAFGDFSPGRYAWKLENVRTIEPFPVKGRQGLFEVEVSPEILANRPQIVPAPIDHFANTGNMLDNVNKLAPPARLERATHGLGSHAATGVTTQENED